MLKGRCDCCGEDIFELLVLDHVYNTGANERKILSSRKIYEKALSEGQDTINYRILCHNCNNAKGIYKFCPHERILGPLQTPKERIDKRHAREEEYSQSRSN